MLLMKNYCFYCLQKHFKVKSANLFISNDYNKNTHFKTPVSSISPIREDIQFIKQIIKNIQEKTKNGQRKTKNQSHFN